MTASDPRATTPAGGQWISPTELEMTWGDGHVSRYPTAYLREHCPCATCKAQQLQGPKGIDLLASQPTDAALASPITEPVGRYAVRFVWGDGHDTGIYPYALLRALCPCETCRKAGVRP